jgi:hypothetical protein
MARRIADQNLLIWEAYPSAGDHGFSSQPYITFNCLTDRLQRPRQHQLKGDEASAEKLLNSATDQELIDLFNRATPVE